MLDNYIKKREGSSGQQHKAYMLLTSRKIVSVKTVMVNTQLYVKAIIKKSYGEETKTATVLSENDLALKGYCECVVGRCGLCCHILALLLYLKHFNQKGEKILSLSCTEQLQK